MSTKPSVIGYTGLLDELDRNTIVELFKEFNKANGVLPRSVRFSSLVWRRINQPTRIQVAKPAFDWEDLTDSRTFFGAIISDEIAPQGYHLVFE